MAIMQPYFFPYLGYISLIKNTDRFILFDTAQFIRHGWIERNKILKPNEGWQYIQVPLIKFHQKTLIKDIMINNKIAWKEKILAQLQHYKKKAPYYYSTVKLLNEILSTEYNDITTLNKRALTQIFRYLGIKKNIVVFSKMNLQIKETHAPDEWALNICDAIEGADEYWNLPGGQNFFDKSKYNKENIKLKFQSIKLQEYDQKREQFESGLSIIDVMMFNSPAEISKMLDNYELI